MDLISYKVYITSSLYIDLLHVILKRHSFHWFYVLSSNLGKANYVTNDNMLQFL